MQAAAKIAGAVWLILGAIIIAVAVLGNFPFAIDNLPDTLIFFLALPAGLPFILLGFLGLGSNIVTFFIVLLEFIGGVGLLAWSGD